MAQGKSSIVQVLLSRKKLWSKSASFDTHKLLFFHQPRSRCAWSINRRSTATSEMSKVETWIRNITNFISTVFIRCCWSIFKKRQPSNFLSITSTFILSSHLAKYIYLFFAIVSSRLQIQMQMRSRIYYVCSFRPNGSGHSNVYIHTYIGVVHRDGKRSESKRKKISSLQVRERERRSVVRMYHLFLAAHPFLHYLSTLLCTSCVYVKTNKFQNLLISCSQNLHNFLILL